MAVVVENLTVTYGDTVAVDNVSFEAPPGCVTVILGPNGAGKTSTIEVCEGFITPASGSVRVLGLDPQRDHHALTLRMGVMLQGGGVYPSARVRDVITHFCALYDKGVRPGELIERVGLSSRATGTWRCLSGGQQQRLSLALALAADPDVIFLDEPTSGVDIDGRDIIRDIIAGLAQRGTTVVLASHDMAEAQRVATHAVLFQHGRIIASGVISALVQDRTSLRFSSSAALSLNDLQIEMNAAVVRLANDTFEIAVPPTTQVLARLTQWLATQGLPLTHVDMGSETLEDAYRRLTGGNS